MLVKYFCPMSLQMYIHVHVYLLMLGVDFSTFHSPSLSLPPSYSGGVVGYHVTLPCQSCLSSCNNGHLWMYNACDIIATERLDHTGVCVGV